MSNHKLSLRRLFSNTKFLVVFSLLIAVIFWIVVALEYAPIVENTIKDVPVKIDMENSVPDKLGLQIFGQKDYTVDITVSGNRYVVGGSLLSPDDFDVTAQTAYVNSSGNHTLQLKVTIKNADADYEIVSTSSEYIEVYFDKYEEKEFEVTPRINSKLDSLTDDGYTFYNDDVIVSTPTVTLSGAETEMNTITAVYADIDVNKKLTESATYDCDLNIANTTNTQTKYISINGHSSLSVPVTLPVYKIQTLPVAVSFKNAPPYYIGKPLSYSCSPSKANVAVLQNGSVSNDYIEIGSIDFSNLSSKKNVFTINSKDIKDIKVLDGTESFKVTVNVDGLSTSTVSIDKQNVVVTGAADEKNISINLASTGKITLAGNDSSVSSVTSSMLTGEIDLTNVDISAQGVKVPLKVTIKDSSNCWVIGTYYAYVSKK